MKVRAEKTEQHCRKTQLNTTMNGTQPWSCHSNPTAEKIGQTVAYCLIFLVSLAGNIVVGIIVYKTRTMRKPINFLIVNMAMSDLFFPVFLFPPMIQMLYIDSWLIGGPLGQALCKLVYFLPDVSTAVSIQSLVLIAVGRFGAVVFRLRPPLISSKRCPFLILATWIVAMALQSPYLVVFKLAEYHGRLVCVSPWEEVFGNNAYENYYLFVFVTFVLIPLVLIAILYIIIFLKLKSQRSPGEQSVNAGEQRQQRERNVLKMAIAIVLGFAVFWLPVVIGGFIVFKFSRHIWSSCSFRYFSTVALFMARANCAINPCICFIFSRNYREGLKTLLS